MFYRVTSFVNFIQYFTIVSIHAYIRSWWNIFPIDIQGVLCMQTHRKRWSKNWPNFADKGKKRKRKKFFFDSEIPFEFISEYGGSSDFVFCFRYSCVHDWNVFFRNKYCPSVVGCVICPFFPQNFHCLWWLFLSFHSFICCLIRHNIFVNAISLIVFCSL